MTVNKNKGEWCPNFVQNIVLKVKAANNADSPFINSMRFTINNYISSANKYTICQRQ